MYTSFLNHYYLANVHQAIALEHTRKQLASIFASNHGGNVDEQEIAPLENISEAITISELDRVWLRHLRADANQK